MEGFVATLMFLTRLPAQALAKICGVSMREGGWTWWAFPLVGCVVGLISSSILMLAQYVGLPALVQGVLVCGAWVLLTGGLHEDGLADSVDGFGGQTRERRLQIMADSRTGNFGVLALVLVLGLEISALASIIEGGAMILGLPASWWLVLLVSMYARAGVVVFAWRSTPARESGLLQRTPTTGEMLVAVLLGWSVVLVLPPLLAVLQVVLGGVWIGLWRRVCIRTIGGVTGDVSGAMVKLLSMSFLVSAAGFYG